MIVAKLKHNKDNQIYKIIILVLFIIPILTGLLVLYKLFSPFGLQVKYNFNIADNADLFGKIKNITRSLSLYNNGNKIEIKNKFQNIDNKVELSIKPISKDFSSIKFNIGLNDYNTTTLLQLKDYKNNLNDSFVIHSNSVEALGKYDYKFNNYLIWAFNPLLKTTDQLISIINNSALNSKAFTACNLDESFNIAPPIIDSKTYNIPRIYPQALRGAHTFYVNVNKDGVLYFAFDKRELHWYDGEDNLKINVIKDNSLVYTDIIPNNGITQGKFGRPLSPGINYKVDLKQLKEGVYKIELQSNDDVIIDNISSKNSKIVLSNDIFIVNNSIYGIPTEPISVYTYAKRIFAASYHDNNTQDILINNKKIPLQQLQDFQSLLVSTIPNKMNEIEFTKNDIKISSTDYFGLSLDSYFKPSLINNIDCATSPLSIFQQQDMLAVKNLSSKELDGTYTLQIPFKENYINTDGNINFVIYNPSIGNSSLSEFDINSLTIELSK